MMKAIEDLTAEEVSTLKNITEGSIFWGGCVIHLSLELTGYDFVVWSHEMGRLSNVETATGADLRNLAALCGVYGTENDGDDEVRYKIAKCKE